MQIHDVINAILFEIERDADSDDGMGRPPLGMKATTIRLSVETIRRIEAQVGNRQLAKFIREAVELELRRREEELKLYAPQRNRLHFASLSHRSKYCSTRVLLWFEPRRLHGNLVCTAGTEDGDQFAIIWIPTD